MRKLDLKIIYYNGIQNEFNIILIIAALILITLFFLAYGLMIFIELSISACCFGASNELLVCDYPDCSIASSTLDFSLPLLFENSANSGGQGSLGRSLRDEEMLSVTGREKLCI